MATKRILGLERLRNSRNGNPRYRVIFTDETEAITQSDAAFCYSIENSEMKENVEVTYSRNGRIANIMPC